MSYIHISRFFKSDYRVSEMPRNIIWELRNLNSDSSANTHPFSIIISNDSFLVLSLPTTIISQCIVQDKKRVKIWLYEDTRMKLEGQIIGFDEYMNMTLDDAVEVDTKTGKKSEIGRILLKGDAITLLQEAWEARKPCHSTNISSNYRGKHQRALVHIFWGV